MDFSTKISMILIAIFVVVVSIIVGGNSEPVDFGCAAPPDPMQMQVDIPAWATNLWYRDDWEMLVLENPLQVRVVDAGIYDEDGNWIQIGVVQVVARCDGTIASVYAYQIDN